MGLFSRTPQSAPSFKVDVSDIDKLVASATGISKAPEDDPELRTRGAAADDAAQNVKLKKMFARGLLGLLFLQLTAANVAFYFFGSSANWRISDAVMLGWISSTVVEIIGIVLIVVKNLFPNRKEA